MLEAKLQGRIAVVIGSTKGIGKAIAKDLAREGATVIVTGRKKELGEQVAGDIRSNGGSAEFMELDIRDAAMCEKLIAQVIKKFKKLNILINNAGIGSATKLENITQDEWDKMFFTNLRPFFMLSKYAMPHLINSGNGSIVFTSSLAGLKPMKMAYLYGSTKIAISHFAKMLAVDYADKGVRVNAVAPGNILTDMIKGAGPEVLKVMEDNIPMKRIGEPEEVAKVVTFLTSDDASYVTGQVIGITGGLDLL